MVGNGLIHAEVSSAEFKKTGGPLEILQLWVNLPAKDKMTAPRYIGLQQDEIPMAKLDGGLVIHAVSDEWAGTAGAVQPLAWLELPAGSRITLPIAAARSIFFYTVRGALHINGTGSQALQLVEFNHDSDELTLEAHRQRSAAGPRAAFQ